MYAPSLIRVFSCCNRSLVLSRQLLSSHSNLKSKNFVTIANDLHRFESNLKCKSLTSVLFSTNSSPSSPEDVHIKLAGSAKKKRRRIISSSSSDDNEKPSPSKSTE